MNIFTQFVADGNSGSVTLCKEEQPLNILPQFFTAGRDVSLASVNAMHELNRYLTSVTDDKFKCDKSAYFNERHLWNALCIVVTNDVSHSGVISLNLPHP